MRTSLGRAGCTCIVALGLILSASALRAVDASGESEKAVAEVRSALGRGDAAQAIVLGEAAVAKYPTQSALWRLLGFAYGSKAQEASLFSKLGLAKKSLAAFEKAVEVDPANVESRLALAGFYIEAPGVAGGSTTKAREQANAILKLDPVRGYILLGDLSAEAKEPVAAEAEYKQAMALDTQSFAGPMALANFYAAQKRWPEATALWQKRLDTTPTDMLARYQLAKLALFSGTGLEAGVEHLKIYLTVPPPPDRPTWADAHWRLALLYEKLGRKADALSELHAALKLNPTHRQALADLKRLEG